MVKRRRAWPSALGIASLVIVAGCNPGGAAKNASSTTSSKAKPTRVAVKHGLDPAAINISRTAKDITIEDLLKMERPEGLADDISSAAFQDQRVGPLETQVWRIKAKVKSIIKRRDGDYFLTIESPSGATTVVEVPDPSLCKGSPLEKDITEVRSELEAKFHPNDKPKDVNAEATIEGVGFWGQKGKPGGKSSGNGARLMPGLGFEWGDH